jgi:hypothetical protein
MRKRCNGRLPAATLLLITAAFWPSATVVTAQDEGAPECGVRLENLAGVDIRFTLKNRKTDWLPMKTLSVSARDPYLNRDEIKFEQKDGTWAYAPIPLEHVYRFTRNDSGWLVITQVPNPAFKPSNKCEN